MKRKYRPRECKRCGRTRCLQNSDPPYCGTCYRLWHQLGKPDELPPFGSRKPYDGQSLDGLADFMTLLKTDRGVYSGPQGGVNYEYVSSRIGRSSRTISRYQAKIRDGHPAVEAAKQRMI